MYWHIQYNNNKKEIKQVQRPGSLLPRSHQIVGVKVACTSLHDADDLGLSKSKRCHVTRPALSKEDMVF